MANPHKKLDFLTSDSVRRATNDRIRDEALRQLDAIDLDDDDATIEPLPAFDLGDATADLDPDQTRFEVADPAEPAGSEEQTSTAN